MDGRKSMNSVNLIGRLTNDVDFRTTSGGKSVANFTLAVNRYDRSSTDFIQCVAWSTAAEILNKYTRKGAQVGISGHLQTRQFEKDGQRRHVTEVIVESITLLESKKTEPQEASEAVNPTGSDDLPF